MSDIQNQIIALRRQISLLDNTNVVFNTEPKNPTTQTIYVNTQTQETKYWDGTNWVIASSWGGWTLTGWNMSVAFTASDYRTIAWTSWVVSISTATWKTDYSTTSGNFTMSATTYFYFNPDTPTSIQTTTTPGLAVSAGWVLIAVWRMNPDTVNKAALKVFGWPSVDQIIADEIVSNSITSNMLQANSITAAKLATILLYAWAITLDTSGNIKSGQTAYDTWTGFFLGDVAWTAKFSIGNSSANKLLWDGTSLTINGSTVSRGDLFGDGSDWDVTISANTSLSRDMNYNNLTVNSTYTLTTNGFRIFVKWTTTVNWTISCAGGNGVNGSSTSDGGAWGAWTTAWFLGNWAAWGAGWFNYWPPWYTGIAWTNNTVALVSTTAAAWGAGGSDGSTPWFAWGAGGTSSGVWAQPRTTTEFVLMRDFYSGSSKYNTSAWAGGGGTGYSSSSRGGTWGGGGWAGWILVLMSKTITNSGTITAKWGNWGNWGNWWADPAWGGWGGWAWNGGVIVLVYNSLTNSWTITVAAGAAGTGWTGLWIWVSGSNGWAGTAWTLYSIQT